MEINKITEQIIGAAIEVHRQLGPGLLESAYEECLCYELRLKGLKYTRQQTLPIVYKEVQLDHGQRTDLLVENAVVVELKTVDSLIPAHEAQILTYLRLSKKSIGLILNFKVKLMTKGINIFRI